MCNTCRSVRALWRLANRSRWRKTRYCRKLYAHMYLNAPCIIHMDVYIVCLKSYATRYCIFCRKNGSVFIWGVGEKLTMFCLIFDLNFTYTFAIYYENLSIIYSLYNTYTYNDHVEVVVEFISFTYSLFIVNQNWYQIEYLVL